MITDPSITIQNLTIDQIRSFNRYMVWFYHLQFSQLNSELQK